MIKIRKFVFDQEDIEVVKNFIQWVDHNFEDDNDWDFLAEDSHINMNSVFDGMQDFYDYMKYHMEEK